MISCVTLACSHILPVASFTFSIHADVRAFFTAYQAIRGQLRYKSVCQVHVIMEEKTDVLRIGLLMSLSGD
jgi:hypothetical protein